ncbi:hypothetical protein IFM89_012599 [Coptis chinensis]|uniref:Pentatricopeptide repeat-containing protein n=1 Tax=Coptis chinensis TaxID=261450 RepID=A0A835M8L3_9MAGN|nr:hypothetical protein IFM89_012599 [Coptis chinensis]
MVLGPRDGPKETSGLRMILGPRDGPKVMSGLCMVWGHRDGPKRKGEDLDRKEERRGEAAGKGEGRGETEEGDIGASKRRKLSASPVFHLKIPLPSHPTFLTLPFLIFCADRFVTTITQYLHSGLIFVSSLLCCLWGEDRRLDKMRSNLGKLAVFWILQAVWVWTQLWINKSWHSRTLQTIEEGGAMLGSGNIIDIQIILASDADFPMVGSFCGFHFNTGSGIPLLEKSTDQKFSNRPEYVFYKRTTSPLIPLPPFVYDKLPAWFKVVFLFELPIYSRIFIKRGGSVRDSRVGADGYFVCHVHRPFSIAFCKHVPFLLLPAKMEDAIRGYLTVCGFAIDTSICKALIDTYSKCGRIDFAREVFNRMPKRDIISWNAMIAGYGIHGLGREALLLFHDLQNEGPKPDYVTFICLLSACSHSGLVHLLA